LSGAAKISVGLANGQLQPTEAWTHIGGLKVRYLTAGNGPPILLLHGLLGYSFSWRHCIPILAQQRTVFAPDMPGAGLSQCSPDLDCHLSGAAGRLLAFLDSVGVDTCDLVGSSYGGATAAAAAALATNRVQSLTLVSPANPWSKIGRKRLRLFRNQFIARAFPHAARPFRGLHAYFVRRMYSDARKVTREALQGYARPLALPGRFEHAVKIARTWNEDMRELEACLPKIADVPTLLIWGSKDRVVDPASSQLLHERFRNVRSEIIPGAGHLPYEECPEEFCRILTEFLSRSTSKREVT